MTTTSTRLAVELLATGDMDACDTYPVANLRAPAEFTDNEALTKRLTELQAEWLNSPGYDPESPDNDFAEWLIANHGFVEESQLLLFTMER